MCNSKSYESPEVELILMMEDVICNSLNNGGEGIGGVGELPSVTDENNP